MNAPNIDVQEHVRLAALTTMSVGGPARYFIEIKEEDDISKALALSKLYNLPVYILGGGSNVVVSDEGFNGVVLSIKLRGIESVKERKDIVQLRVAAGETWDRFVAYCVQNGWGGAENMSWIPGTVGAVPIQNVGAYGQEAGQIIQRVEAWDTLSKTSVCLPSENCAFRYRSSIFNTTEAGRYIITYVVFTVHRHGCTNLSHTSVVDYLARQKRTLRTRLGARMQRYVPFSCKDQVNRWRLNPTLAEMREAVIALRTDGRLPDLAQAGNAGSFFKNVTLEHHVFAACLDRIEARLGAAARQRIEKAGQRYEVNGLVKLPSAELVKICGLEGLRQGGAQLYERNPIILINPGGMATGEDIRLLAQCVIRTVDKQTGIRLEPEPQFVGFGSLSWDLVCGVDHV